MAEVDSVSRAGILTADIKEAPRWLRITDPEPCTGSTIMW